MFLIRSEAAKHSTADLVGWCKRPLADIGEQFGNKLVSYYRQLVFVLSVMMETPEPERPEAITPATWGRFCRDLNWLFLQYGVLDIDRAAASDDVAFRQTWLSKSAYLHHFNTGALASDRQILRWFEGTLVPFDSGLAERCGFSATDAITLYRAIIRNIQDRDDERYMRMFGELTDIATPGPILAATCAVVRGDFLDVLPSAALHSFWSTFTARRGDLQPITRYPTDPHHLEQKPFIEVRDGIAFFTVPGAALGAMGSRLSSVLLESELRAKYLKKRDEYLESEVLRVFSTFFASTGARLFPDAHIGDFQHDLLVLDGSRVLIVEAKAGFMKEPFRDLDRAYTRLKQNFDRVIGAGHEQASRTRTRLLQHETLLFVTSRREPLVEIDGRKVTEVLTMCVTADDFGPLGRDMSALLERQPDEIYPWVIMLNDLETFLSSFPRLGVNPAHLFRFVRERATLHGRVESGDELELAGYFLKHRTLMSLDNGPGTVTQVDSEYSDIFDRLYFDDETDL